MDGTPAGIPATLPPLGDLQAAFRGQGYVTGEALGTALRLVVALGRPLLLEGGLDWKPMSLSPKDMDFMEAKHTAAREIARGMFKSGRR